MLGAQAIHHRVPAAAPIQPSGPRREVRLQLLLEMVPVAPQLRSRVAQRVLVMEAEVEVLLAQREPIRRPVQPAPEIAGERAQGRDGRVTRRGESRRLIWRLLRDRGGDLLHQVRPAFGDLKCRFHEHAHRLRQRGARVVQEHRHVFQPAAHRPRALRRRAIAAQHEEMQPPEEVGQPESGVLRLRALALEAPQGDANVVEQGGAVDLVFERGGGSFLERRRDGLERREVRRQGGGTVAPEPIIVRRDAGLRGGHGIEVPPQVEVRALDLLEGAYRHAACFSNRWHSSSESTRSARFAASNRAAHAASSAAS